MLYDIKNFEEKIPQVESKMLEVTSSYWPWNGRYGFGFHCAYCRATVRLLILVHVF